MVSHPPCVLQEGSQKALMQYWGGAEEIVCKVIKLNNLTVAKRRDSGNMLYQSFSSFENAF